MTIEEIRQKYPQYSDLSDEQLLKGLHSKFYSDLPYEQFASSIGTTAPEVTVTAKAPTAEEKAAFEKEQNQPEDSTFLSRSMGLGSPFYSAVRGAIVEPVLGVNQFLANTGLFGEDVKKAANELVTIEAEASRKAREEAGRGGFDAYALGGAIVSPANKLLSMGTATTALQRIGQSALSGGIFGAMQPVEGKDYGAEKNFQIGLGVLFGGSLGTLGETLPKLREYLGNIPITAKNKAESFKKYVEKLLPAERDELINKLTSAGELVSGSQPTVAEVVSDIPSAYKLAKAQERLEGKASTAGAFIERRATQQQARLNALEDVFGSSADLELAKQSRLTTTTPMRERALKEADFYGETASKLEQQLKQGTSYLGSVNSKQRNDLLKAQVENIKANGYYPLTSEGLINKIDNVVNSPGTRSNEMLTYAVSKLRGKLAKYTNENGIINSADLYNIRKEIAQDIAEYSGSKNMATASFRAQATDVETQLKKIIDAEINKASGSTLWTDYLAKFAEHSKKIDQLELGQTLKSRLEGKFSEETAGKFLQAMQDTPATIKKATGQARYKSIDELLTEPQLAAVNKVYADVLRQEKAFLSGKGIESAKAAELNAAQEIPGFISTSVTFVKNVLRDLIKGSQEEFDNRMTELMLDPKKFAAFLETIPNQNQQAVFKAMQGKASPTVRQRLINIYSSPIPTTEEAGRATIQQYFK
jgi:hypothetical protein